MKFNQFNTKIQEVNNKPQQLGIEYLLKLHYEEDGTSLKRWVRVTSALNEDLLYDKLSEIIEFIKNHKNINQLLELRDYLSKELKTNINITTLYGLRGGKFWGRRRGIPIKILDYFIKEYSILSNKPLHHIQNEFFSIIDSIVISGGNRIKLIKHLNEDLCYLLGMIVADGSCPNAFSRKNKEYKDYRIKISKDNESFLEYLSSIFYSSFGIRPRVFKDIHSGPNMWSLDLKSKYIFRLLTKIFEIPVGKKSDIVKMPQIIKNSTKENQFAFIKGVMDGDGCVYIYRQTTKKPYGTYHYTRLKALLRVKSELLVSDIAECLKNNGYKLKEFSYLGNTFDRTSKIQFFGFYLISQNAEKYAKEIGFLHPNKIKKVKEFYQQAVSLQH